MHGILIREMFVEDVPEVLHIEQLSFTSPWSEEAFLSEIRKSYSFTRIAVLDNTVAGYICVNYILNECHILNLAVHPRFRRKGIATTLMQEAFSEMGERNCRFFYLEVRISNTGAQTFYGRLGFRVAGTRKRYYSSPVEDAVMMMRRV